MATASPGKYGLWNKVEFSFSYDILKWIMEIKKYFVSFNAFGKLPGNLG